MAKKDDKNARPDQNNAPSIDDMLNNESCNTDITWFKGSKNPLSMKFKCKPFIFDNKIHTSYETMHNSLNADSCMEEFHVRYGNDASLHS